MNAITLLSVFSPNVLFQYVLLTGHAPFQRKESRTIERQIVENDVVMPEVSDQTKSLLQALLEKNPQNRIASNEIMAHCFFDSIEWNIVIEKKLTPPFIPPDRTIPFDRESILKTRTIFNFLQDDIRTEYLPYANDTINADSLIIRCDI